MDEGVMESIHDTFGMVGVMVVSLLFIGGCAAIGWVASEFLLRLPRIEEPKCLMHDKPLIWQADFCPDYEEWSQCIPKVHRSITRI